SRPDLRCIPVRIVIIEIGVFERHPRIEPLVDRADSRDGLLLAARPQPHYHTRPHRVYQEKSRFYLLVQRLEIEIGGDAHDLPRLIPELHYRTNGMLQPHGPD